MKAMNNKSFDNQGSITMDVREKLSSEKRLIDANALIKEGNEDGAYGYVDTFQIANAPTVDAVEVVRCRECRYRFGNNGHSKNGCPIIDANIWMDDDDFCSHGERKEGAD